MRNAVDQHSNEPNILLVGGPELPSDTHQRVRFTVHPDAPVKLLAGNRYEHFEPTSRRQLVDGRELVVFEWSRYTKVAE